MTRHVLVTLVGVAIGIATAVPAAAERDRIVLLPIARSSALLFADERDKLQEAPARSSPSVRVATDCFGGSCTLHLELRRPTISEWISFDTWKLIAEIVEGVPRGASIDQWIAVLRASRPEPAWTADDGEGSAGIGMVGGLGKHRFGSGAADRRTRIGLRFHGAKTVSGVIRDRAKRWIARRGTAGYPSPDYEDPLSAAGHAFTPCVVANRTAEHNAEFEVEFALDPSGPVTAATLRGEHEIFSPAELACMEKAAKKIAFPCPIDDSGIVTGIYSVF